MKIKIVKMIDFSEIVNLRAGDIILYHGRSWVSRQILKWMNMYRRKLKLTQRPLYNHVSVVIELWGEKYTVEAVARGVVMNPILSSVSHVKSIKGKTWAKPLSKSEQHEFNRFAVRLATSNIEYDFFNFLWQMIKVKFGKWFGPKGVKSKHRLYCSELAAVVMDHVRNSFNGHTADVNPLDIDLNKDLIDKSDEVKKELHYKRHSRRKTKK